MAKQLRPLALLKKMVLCLYRDANRTDTLATFCAHTEGAEFALLDRVFARDPGVLAAAEEFLQRRRDVDGCALHVVQGEWATVHLAPGPAARPLLVGSTDATTCCIAVLVDSASRAASVAHHDDTTTVSCDAIIATLGAMRAPHLWLLGGAGHGGVARRTWGG